MARAYELAAFGLVLCALLGSGAQVHAGEKLFPSVVINPSTKTASGAIGTTRRVGSIQFIGCNTVGNTQGISCIAQSEGGVFVFCSWAFPDERALTMMGTLNPDSFITFSWNDQNLCTKVTVTNSSRYEPTFN